MVVLPSERVPIARLLRFLEQGERLAHDCARAQAKLAPDPALRRFLSGQARQEAAHAVIFQATIAWLAPRHLGPCPLLAPLERYRALIDEALGRGNFAETILAEQIILEGLGEAILQRIEAGLVKRRAPFTRLRRLFLLQEEAHHATGCRFLERQVATGQAPPDALRSRVQAYLELAQAMVMTLADLFTSIDEDPSAWASDVQQYLPHWLKSSDFPIASRLTPHASRPI